MIVHAGTETGFVPNAFWAFKAVEDEGDYHKSMDSFCFEKWFNTQLLPNIPPRSVIVMDNASYHSQRTKAYPISSWKKDQLQSWLREREIEFPEDARKAECWEIVKKHRNTNSEYVCDKKAKEAGHEVLRLPPYHSEFNPIELVWAQVKGYVAARNTKHTLKETEQLLSEAVLNVTAENWEACCRHVENKEHEAWERDGMLDQEMAEIVINFDSDTDENPPELESGKSSESE